MWRRRGRREDPLPADVAAECAAFLSGDYAKYLEGRGSPIPVWAWTNLLAHAPEQEIRSMLSASEATSGRWRHAYSYVAGEVLDFAEQHKSLSELQATVLLPLELELASRREAASWAPDQWVAAVMAVLHEHGHTRRQP